VCEGFRRKRAASFVHRRSRPYQMLVEQDMIRAARATQTRFEVRVRLSNKGTGITVGTRCIVRESNGKYDLVHGNIVVAHLAPDADDTIRACKQAAPSFNGIIPCCVSRVGEFSSVSLKLDSGDDDAS
jgi:hypothetical protein